VGYGDIDIENNYERMIAQFIEILGVVLFTVANASLISICESLDDSGEYKDKVDTFTILSKHSKVPI
jgi:hypothetical protein